MFDVPDPFHAAVVHFPIVFILVGTVLALFTTLTKRAFLPQFTALFLVLAAGSAQYAVMTGEDQAREILKVKPAAKTLIEHHAEWGERTRTVSAAAGLCALLALLFVRTREPFPPRRERISGAFRRALSILTVLVALGASYCVIATGERGGEMVFQHGVGIQAKPEASVGPPNPQGTGTP
jgi:uncharacterized membrane protein